MTSIDHQSTKRSSTTSTTVSTTPSAGVSVKRFIFRYDQNSTDESSYWFLEWRSSKFFIIATVVMGIYVDIFLYGSTVVVLPFVLEDQAGVPHEEIGKWTGYSMLSYSIASFISSPIAGFLADKASNRREPLMVGLLFLLAGCICLWAAKSVAVLLFGRVLQGVSAGFVWSIGLALIADTVGDDEIGKVLAYADISLCFGIASAPPISGSILNLANKDAVYGMIMGLIIVDVFMRLVLIEQKTVRKIRAANAQTPSGDAALDPALGGKEGPRGYLEYISILLKSWRIFGALCGTWASAHVLITIDVVVPVYCEERYGWGPLKVGMLLLTFYGPSLLCILTGHLADKHDGRWLAIGGFLGCIPSFLGLTTVEKLSDSYSQIIMWILMPCAGISLSFANTPVMAEIVYALMDKQERYPSLKRNSGGYGMAYGMFMTVFSLGCGTASAISPPLLEMKNNGWSAVMYSLAACCFLVVIPIAIFTGRKIPGGRLGMRKPSRVEEPVVEEAA